MNTNCFIYTLAHPLTGEVRYVGKAVRPHQRLLSHLKDREKTHKVNWIKSLFAQGLQPKLEILEEVSSSAWEEAERFWIQSLKFMGCRLTNSNGGGLGGKEPSIETRKRIGEANKLRVTSEETRRKISAATSGRVFSAAHREKISKASKSRKIGRHVIEAAIKALTGRVFTEERKEAIRKASKARMAVPENREKISVLLKGVKKSQAHRDAIKASWTLRRKISPLLGETGSPRPVKQQGQQVTNNQKEHQ